MKKLFLILSLLVVFTMAACDSHPASAASKYADYPAKNIELICPSAAGTGFDALARKVAEVLPKFLPKSVTVFVSNLNNGGGAEGWTKGYLAAPDGYTLLLYGVPDSLISQVLYERQYDVMKFTPLAGLTYEPSVFLAKADSAAKNFADVKKQAEQNPAVFGTSGAGGSTHLESLVTSTVLNIPARMVHFSSVPEVMTSFERKETEFISLTLPTSLSWIRSGSAKPIVVMAKERVKELPDIPTVYETEGITKEQADLLSNTLQYRRAIWAPPGMDDELSGILIKALEQAVNSPEFQEWSASVSRPITFIPGIQFNEVIMTLFNNHSDFIELYRKNIFN